MTLISGGFQRHWNTWCNFVNENWETDFRPIGACCWWLDYASWKSVESWFCDRTSVRGRAPCSKFQRWKSILKCFSNSVAIASLNVNWNNTNVNKGRQCYPPHTRTSQNSNNNTSKKANMVDSSLQPKEWQKECLILSKGFRSPFSSNTYIYTYI